MKSKRLPSPPYNPGVRDLVEGKRACSRPLAKDEIERGFLGWHENGYLPHRDERGLIRRTDAPLDAVREPDEPGVEVEHANVDNLGIEDLLDLVADEVVHRLDVELLG